MARIAGVDIPDVKRGEIGLTYIFGIGINRARKILLEAGVDVNTKVKDWSDEDQVKIRAIITETIKVEGVLLLLSKTQLIDGYRLLQGP